jgi:dTDP-4-dehydrorhamnose reductase/dTDP-4-dehydrorhamnose 3,5-epimerase
MVEPLTAERTPIAGLLMVRIPLHRDERGWFKENWQRQAMVSLGLPDFQPVQNNISMNIHRGTVRGIHAEPWDKLVSVASGRVFGVWVDLRIGEGFGKVFTAEIGPETAVYVPSGVANGFQTLEDNTAYSYLVNAHWSKDAVYTMVNYADPQLGIKWPLPLSEAHTSEKDRSHPMLNDVKPIESKPILVLGLTGQVGKAFLKSDLNTVHLGRQQVDFEKTDAFEGIDFSKYSAVVNAVAYTDVDGAETLFGGAQARQVNAGALKNLVKAMGGSGLPLVHISSDYVFDGKKDSDYTEVDFPKPLGVYGQSKADGDAIVSQYPKHLILRTSWVIGDRKNFVATMVQKAQGGNTVEVVMDQYGRPSFADEIVAATKHILENSAPHGVYNVTSGGRFTTWYEIAVRVYETLGVSKELVKPVKFQDYAAGKALAHRPVNSRLDLSKLHQTGFVSARWEDKLGEYLQGL